MQSVHWMTNGGRWQIRRVFENVLLDHAIYLKKKLKDLQMIIR